MNGRGLSSTNLTMPCAMRRFVLSASSFFRSKIDGQGMRPVDDLRRGAPRQALAGEHLGEPGLPWVGSGQTIGLPSRRAIMKKRLRMVGAP
jgi:hypothetical protein